jgi:hypothetical protein
MASDGGGSGSVPWERQWRSGGARKPVTAVA